MRANQTQVVPDMLRKYSKKVVCVEYLKTLGYLAHAYDDYSIELVDLDGNIHKAFKLILDNDQQKSKHTSAVPQTSPEEPVDEKKEDRSDSIVQKIIVGWSDPAGLLTRDIDRISSLRARAKQPRLYCHFLRRKKAYNFTDLILLKGQYNRVGGGSRRRPLTPPYVRCRIRRFKLNFYLY